ncbi:hypothetical protein [Arthrobacter sp. N199823]|uniref:hypothetical protein n=1 Tax=Arthrobacter sp. N199823 TaxID=2058895 RepID=UPI0011B0D497|nr:hypothetical protein [Arthrobacter sp. N199823]
MSGPQPWPGPQGNAAGHQGAPPPPPVGPPSPAGPLPPAGPPSGAQPKGAGKIIAWTVAGTVLVGAIVVGAVIAANTLWGTPAAPAPVAVSSSQEQAVPEAAAPEAAHAAPPSATPAPSSVPTPDTSGYSNADKAYCKWQGKVIFVGASDSFRAAICEINGQTTYLGLDKKTGLATVLPAYRSSDSATAHKDNYAYNLNSSAFEITQNNKVIAEEKMLSWWTPSAPEMQLPGDLGLSQPISYPSCNGSGVIILGTFFDPATNVAAIDRALKNNPGSMYLRTDLSCGNFRGPSLDNSNGNSIYAVVKAIPGSKSDVCEAMKQYDAAGEWLENGVDAAKNIQCS